jgi:hypothetical protein
MPICRLPACRSFSPRCYLNAERSERRVGLAGAEGEIEVLGSLRCRDGNDRRTIEHYAEQLVGGQSWSQVEPRLRTTTRMLVRRHLLLIERVAAALLDRKTLSGEELDELVGRSVDDVRAIGG